ncbi:hypothetical protein C8T65DRAFT_167136 [Cerioporus squamosus]|nr:hypothetical protein C8T65DRAFT_167136 [Cerioporus squamosus]
MKHTLKETQHQCVALQWFSLGTLRMQMGPFDSHRSLRHSWARARDSEVMRRGAYSSLAEIQRRYPSTLLPGWDRCGQRDEYGNITYEFRKILGLGEPRQLSYGLAFTGNPLAEPYELAHIAARRRPSPAAGSLRWSELPRGELRIRVQIQGCFEVSAGPTLNRGDGGEAIWDLLQMIVTKIQAAAKRVGDHRVRYQMPLTVN